MLFLLNDVVLNLDLETLTSPDIARVLPTMSFPQVLALGREMFAQSPRLQHVAVGGPTRLATLIMAKHPEINAALFSAPAAGCAPEAVVCRLASLGVELILDLNTFQERGGLSKALCDFHVWGKLRAEVA